MDAKIQLLREEQKQGMSYATMMGVTFKQIPSHDQVLTFLVHLKDMYPSLYIF